eukprot:6067652-Heterocapsa_arctica.AAC.1
MVCRGTRGQVCCEVADRSTTTCFDALDACWLTIFGPMKVLIYDGELALDCDEATAYGQIKGIIKRTAA